MLLQLYETIPYPREYLQIKCRICNLLSHGSSISQPSIKSKIKHMWKNGNRYINQEGIMSVLIVLFCRNEGMFWNDKRNRYNGIKKFPN